MEEGWKFVEEPKLGSNIEWSKIVRGSKKPHIFVRILNTRGPATIGFEDFF